MDNLLPALVGGLFAILAGLVGAWIQSRREHEKWLRERRFETYRELSEYLYRQTDLDRRAELVRRRLLNDGIVNHDGDVPAELAELFAEMQERREESFGSATAIQILGPESVRRAASLLLRADARDRSAVSAAQTALDVAMRSALRITD